MIIDQTNGPIQVLVALLKDAEGRGIRSFGEAGKIIEFLKQHPDEDFQLQAFLNGPALPASSQRGLEAGDICTGVLRFDTREAKIVYGARQVQGATIPAGDC